MKTEIKEEYFVPQNATVEVWCGRFSYEEGHGPYISLIFTTAEMSLRIVITSEDQTAKLLDGLMLEAGWFAECKHFDGAK